MATAERVLAPKRRETALGDGALVEAFLVLSALWGVRTDESDLLWLDQ